MKQQLLDLWSLVRALATDDAYERYLDHHRQAHGEVNPIARQSQPAIQGAIMWTGVKRCC